MPEEQAAETGAQDSTLLGGNTDTNASQQSETPEAQPAEGQPVETAAADDKAGETAVPEKYEFAMPEGIELNSAVADQFSEFAKERGLSQEDAQAVADLGAQLVQKQAEQQAEDWTQVRKQWADEVRADKEIGGDRLQENLGYAAKWLDTYAPDLREMLDATGFGDHPQLVRALVKAGKDISQDRLVGGEQRTPSADRDPARVLFPTMN